MFDNGAVYIYAAPFEPPRQRDSDPFRERGWGPAFVPVPWRLQEDTELAAIRRELTRIRELLEEQCRENDEE